MIVIVDSYEVETIGSAFGRAITITCRCVAGKAADQKCCDYCGFHWLGQYECKEGA